MGLTLYEKIWHAHKVLDGDDGQSLLHVARHLVHDGSVHAFQFLKEKGLTVRRSDQVVATPDHGISTRSHVMAAITDPEQRRVVERLVENTQAHGILHFPLGDPRQGIVHVVGPEQGLTQPGMVLVCGDSHTSTHGALGALAFGAGASEITHVLATQATWQRRSKTLRVRVEGVRGAHVSAKDVILAIIAKLGSNGAAGHVLEYAGSAIRAMSIEERLTVCNMSIEAGARAGMVAPDDTTFAYLQGRTFAPKGAMWEQALDHWRSLPSDVDARFDIDIELDAHALEPMVTWGNSPQDGLPITARVPNPQDEPDSEKRAGMERALAYMGLQAGMALQDIAVDQVFIGSCTNGRIEDLRAAAVIAKGRKVAAGVNAIVVPGSGLVKEQAEEEGLDKVFLEAGFEWRDPGCSMCLAMNADKLKEGERCASTSNRNFEGRQGRGGRTHLVSPAMAAAAAVTGHLTDVRTL